jgi:xanthosine utilization system XapX-like protein
MQPERKHSEGLVALGAGLTVVCLGASLIAPAWAGWVYIVVGIVGAAFGFKWVREASNQAKRH